MNVLKRAQWMSERGHKCLLFCVEGSQIQNESRKSNIKQISVQRNKKSFDFSNSIKLKRKLKGHQVSTVWFADKRDLSLIIVVKFLMRKNLQVLFQQSMRIGVKKKEWWHTVRFRQIDYWIAPLVYLKDQVNQKTRMPIEKVHVIHQGLEVIPFVDGLPTKEKAREYFGFKREDIVIGMIGRIDFAKSQQFVKNVMADLIQENEELRMLVVGNKTAGEWEDYYTEFVQDIKENHSNGDIKLFPFMEDVGMFYEAIDVFVMASKNETYGMVTIEAMLAGKVIVGTNSAGTKELLDNETRGYSFDWMNSQSLKKALLEVISKPDEAREKANQAAKYAKTAFSHISELEQIEQLLLEDKKSV
jgi:D-inositol-3-phosphate glycosyltransferase